MKTALQAAAEAAAHNARDGLIIKLEAVQNGIIVRGRAPAGTRFAVKEELVSFEQITEAVDEHILADAVRSMVRKLGFACRPPSGDHTAAA